MERWSVWAPASPFAANLHLVRRLLRISAITMQRCKEAVLALAAGAITGALVLGVGGRLLMAALVLAAGGRPGFSFGGSIEVVMVGTAYGAVGGLLLLPLRQAVGGNRRLAGPLLGLVLFGLGWLTSRVGRAAAAGPGGRLAIVIGLAALAFVAYGLTTNALLARWLRRRSGVMGGAA